ncbi:hypothetical protein AB4039_38395 [Streptomyces sp. M-16]|uniref:hypothetical protein n=1 Tax=Streptomyces sp. M-16 TaxID=3233040 RepID=UPI003F94F4D7
MRAASGPLSGGEKSDPGTLGAVRRAEQALAQVHLHRTAGHSRCADRGGQKAAIGRRLGWSRRHVTTLASAYRAGEPDQQERAEAV